MKPSGTVLRRRQGQLPERLEHKPGEAQVFRQQLDSHLTQASAAERVRSAADRLAMSLEGKDLVRSTITLRGDQESVFGDMVQYFGAAADHLRDHPAEPFTFGRFIQPPRTGKTVIMARTIAGAATTAVILVPSTSLVNQITRELRNRLPSVAVGVYYGEEKKEVQAGVIVATYQIVQQHAHKGTLPTAIKEATLVFCDEAHKAMTPARMDMLRTAFAPGALRIACTATPDWSEKRTLAEHFPHLIHEITLQEAVALDLFAPLKVQVMSVSVDGSSLRVIGGDFDQAQLGQIMGEVPFLEASRVIRYEHADNRNVPALICCSSVQQAKDVFVYLGEHRPKGAPMPALIIGDDPDKTGRERALADFEAGKIDTLINVGVLIEGWDSPRCKLEIDLAPTMSEVRAKQKYFRVMTKYEDVEARIYLLLPETMKQIPIFPQVLFGKSVELQGFEQWLAKAKPKTQQVRVKKYGKRYRVEGVKLKTDLLHEFHSADQRLNPHNLAQIRAVVESAFPPDETEELPKYWQFLRQPFTHELFSGLGAHLLRYCGIRRQHASYLAFMSRIFPDSVASHLLTRDALGLAELPSSQEAAEHLIGKINEGYWGDSTAEGYRALFGPEDNEQILLEDMFDAHRRLVRASEAFADLPQRYQFVLLSYLGMATPDGKEYSYKAIGKQMGGVSGSRVSQMLHEGMRRLRDSLEPTITRPRYPGDGYVPTQTFESTYYPLLRYRTYWVWWVKVNANKYLIIWRGKSWQFPTDARPRIDEATGALLAEYHDPMKGFARRSVALIL